MKFFNIHVPSIFTMCFIILSHALSMHATEQMISRNGTAVIDGKTCTYTITSENIHRDDPFMITFHCADKIIHGYIVLCDSLEHPRLEKPENVDGSVIFIDENNIKFQCYYRIINIEHTSLRRE